MNTSYTVKQTAKILGFSTNSVYKYLKQGSLKAIRTQPKGRFRISKKSLEDFLGQKLPQKNLVPISKLSLPSTSPSLLKQSPTHHSSKSRRTIRFLLIFSLLLIISDLFTTKDFSFLSQMIRIILAAIFIILAYQGGNFKKSKNEN